MKNKSKIETLRAKVRCICGCKRIVFVMITEEDGQIAVIKCYKCGTEIDHASDMESLKLRYANLA